MTPDIFEKHDPVEMLRFLGDIGFPGYEPLDPHMRILYIGSEGGWLRFCDEKRNTVLIYHASGLEADFYRGFSRDMEFKLNMLKELRLRHARTGKPLDTLFTGSLEELLDSTRVTSGDFRDLIDEYVLQGPGYTLRVEVNRIGEIITSPVPIVDGSFYERKRRYVKLSPTHRINLDMAPKEMNEAEEAVLEEVEEAVLEEENNVEENNHMT